MLTREARRKGSACEAMKLTIDHALRVLRLDEMAVPMTLASLPTWELMDKNFQLPARSFKGDYGMKTQYSIKEDDWPSKLH